MPDQSSNPIQEISNATVDIIKCAIDLGLKKVRKENEDLKRQMLKQSDDAEKSQKEADEKIKKLQEENDELKSAVASLETVKFHLDEQLTFLQNTADLADFEILAAPIRTTSLLSKDLSPPASSEQKKEEIDPNEIRSVIIVGGKKRSSRNCDHIYLYNSKNEIFEELKLTLPDVSSAETAVYKELKKEEEEWTQLGMAVVKNQIYIFGGTKYSRTLNCCYKLEKDGKWTKLANMNEGRSHISNSCLVYKDEIWVIGGINAEGNSLKSVEKYNPLHNKWSKMPDLNTERSSAAAAIFNDQIYVSGGSSNDEINLKSMEIFNPRRKIVKWEVITSSLPTGIHSHCMLTVEKELILLGGKGDSASYKGYTYNGREWTQLDDYYQQERQCFGAVNLFEKLTVFGGFGNILKDDFPSQIARFDSVEVFRGNAWLSERKLPTPLSDFAYSLLPQEVENHLIQQFSRISA